MTKTDLERWRELAFCLNLTKQGRSLVKSYLVQACNRVEELQRESAITENAYALGCDERDAMVADLEIMRKRISRLREALASIAYRHVASKDMSKVAKKALEDGHE